MPFQVRGAVQTVLTLRLIAPEDEGFFRLLLDKIAHSPDFFRDAPLVLDVAPLAAQPPIDLAAFVGQLRQHRLMPVGIQNGAEAWNEAARQAGLAVFGAGGQVRQPAPEPPPRTKAVSRPEPAPAVAAEPPPMRRTLVIREPVRGGQQIVVPDGDLVVLAPVSAGAELAAAGNIHVYARLRGRAFAGIGGDEQALIFCDQLEAELLSIAGVHLVNEEIDPNALRKRARIALEDERLVLHSLP